MRITKNGRGLTVEIPHDVALTLDLKEGDEVQVQRTGSSGVVSEQRRSAAIEEIRSFRGRLPADYEFNREEANARR